MSKARFLYLVQSPLQAINAFEARRSIADGVQDHDIVVLEQKGEQASLLLANTLKALGWSPLITIPFCEGFACRSWQWWKLRTALKRLSCVERVYLGDFTAGMASAAANLFPLADRYLLDDGTSTHNFPAFRYEGRRPEHLPANRNVPIMGYKTNLPKELTFFSIYDVAVQSPDNLIRNHLTFLQDSLRFDPQGPVFFIGSCLPDVEVITYEQFFTLFRSARRFFGGREILYFPHRRELLDRKRDFFREMDVRFAQPELPFELELIHGAIKPSVVATFYSTALDTLRIMNRGQRGGLQSFYVPEDWVQTGSHREIARQSYADYRASTEVEVIENYLVGAGHHADTVSLR